MKVNTLLLSIRSRLFIGCLMIFLSPILVKPLAQCQALGLLSKYLFSVAKEIEYNRIFQLNVLF